MSSYKDDKKDVEAEILVTDAVPANDFQQQGPPIPPGHARFYCEKCQTVRSSVLFRSFSTMVIRAAIYFPLMLEV